MGSKSLVSSLLGSVLLALLTPPLEAQQGRPPEIGRPPGEPPSAHMVRNVPLAVVANGLFSSMANHPEFDGWFASRGLDRASEAVLHFRELALELEREHPQLWSPEEQAELEALADDPEAYRQYQLDRVRARYHAAGVAFGRWLEARQAEGYPPQLLIQRLLVPAREGTSFGSSRSLEAAKKSLRRHARAFEVGLQEAMETVPPLLRADAWEGR